MMHQKQCPFCKAAASHGCQHLAVAVEGREFVRRCVELCHGQGQWRTLCEGRRRQGQQTGEWSPEKEDYTWLETAFCEEFLKRLRWYGGMDYEWRSGPKLQQGGFWVLLWSRDPQRLWWELRDEFERQALGGGNPKSEARGPKSADASPQRPDSGAQGLRGLRAWRS
jgi:hypothetical protein